ncbi:hypothetical protein M3J09_008959 [Ascochyta lentis]
MFFTQLNNCPRPYSTTEELRDNALEIEILIQLIVICEKNKYTQLTSLSLSTIGPCTCWFNVPSASHCHPPTASSEAAHVSKGIHHRVGDVDSYTCRSNAPETLSPQLPCKLDKPHPTMHLSSLQNSKAIAQ